MYPQPGGHPQGLHLVSNRELPFPLNYRRHTVLLNYRMLQICSSEREKKSFSKGYISYEISVLFR